MIEINTYDWFKKWAVYHPQKVAFKCYESGEEKTYGEIHTEASQAAWWLSRKYGLKKGDRIAVLADNCLEYIVLFSVCQKSGITLVPLNYRLAGPELNFMIENCDPALIFTEEKYLHKVQNLDAYKAVPTRLNLTAINDLLKSDEFHNEAFEQVEFDENHPLFLIYTSGTTAYPKGAIYSHRMLFWNSINTAIRLEITTNDRALNCAPPFHTGGWNVLQSTFVLFGGYTLLMKSFDGDAVLDVLENDKHTIFWGVPTMLKMMAAGERFDACNLSNIRYMVLGGEAMPIPLIEKYHKKGVPIRQGYGLTEVGPNVYSLDHSDAIRKQGSIGTPNFFYDVMLVDKDGNAVPDEVAGELLLKAPTVTPGYWRNDKATNDTIVDGWFHTGDLVKRDNEGYYYVVDRIKNMYISGGENVYPAEVEHLIRKIPQVADVAIIGVPHEKWGETGMAFIVLKEDGAITKDEIIAFCLENLAKYKTPAHIKFISELPLNNAGKVDRKQLKALNHETA